MIRDRPYGYYGQANRERAIPVEMDERDAANSRLTVMKVTKSLQNPPRDINRPFSDEEFRCLPTDLEGVDRNNRVVWQRLSQLVNPIGRLFAAEHFSHFDRIPHLPTFFCEVGLLPPFHYETLFMTPDFTNNGMYKIIANVQGEFKVIVIDDMIPVYEHNMEPIWGMNPEVAWQLLLLKAWAKIVGGYRNVATNCRPFEFLRTFTFPGWRLKNLERFDVGTAWRFLNTKLKGDMLPYNVQNGNQNQNIINLQQISNTKAAYDPPPGQSYFTVIAKTKNSERLEACGLQKNAAAYQVTNVLDIQGRKAVKIISSIDSRWNGDFSVVDQKVNNLYDPQTHDINLTKSFIMPFDDFMKLFGLILITNINYRQLPSVKHTSYTVDLPPMQKQSQHYKFIVRQPGMFCLSVIQGIQNMVQNMPRQKGPVLSKVVAKPGQQNTMGIMNGSSVRVSQTNIQAMNVPSITVNPMQGSRSSSPMNQPIRTSNMGPNQQNDGPPPLPSNMQLNLDFMAAQLLPPTDTNNTIGQVNIRRPPQDPWLNKNPWPDVIPQDINSGVPLRSTMRPISPIPEQRPPLDPWLNRNPWMDPPAFSPGISGLVQQVPLNQPNMPQGGQVAPTNIVSRDPWQNRNPWSGPPIPIGQSQQSSFVPPPSSLVPGVTQLVSSRVSGQQVLDPWFNRDPWGPNSPSQITMNRLPISQPIQQSGVRSPSPVPMGSFNSTSVIQQVTMDPWQNRDPWRNPPTVPPPSLRGGGGPQNNLTPTYQYNQYNGETSQASSFLPSFNQIGQEIRPGSPVTSLNYQYVQQRVTAAIPLVPKQSISVPFNNLNIPTNPGYTGTLPTYNPPVYQPTTQNLVVPDRQSQLSWNHQPNNYISVTGSRQITGDVSLNHLAMSHTRPLETSHLRLNTPPPVVAQVSPMQLSRSPSAKSVQPQGFVPLQSNFSRVPSTNGQMATFGPAGQQSYLPYNPQLRFLSNRILLSRATNNKRMNTSRPGPLDFLSQSEDSQQFIDIDQLRGYTAGQAYFYKLQPGEYTLTVKIEPCQKPTSYTVNFMSQMPIIASPMQLQKPQKSLVARSAILDFARQRGDKSYLDDRKAQWVSFGPTFNEYGYGFIAFCSERGAQHKLYCQINTKKLREEGYELKDLYRQKDGLVGVFSEEGIGKCIILKRRRLDAVWPPTAIAIYQTRRAQ